MKYCTRRAATSASTIPTATCRETDEPLLGTVGAAVARFFATLPIPSHCDRAWVDWRVSRLGDRCRVVSERAAAVQRSHAHRSLTDAKS